MSFEPNTEGIFFGLPESVYRKAPGINISSLKLMESSPAHYDAEKRGELSREATPAQQFGTALHTACLEPDALIFRYAVKPEGMTFTTKEGKAWKAAQTLPIITADDLCTAHLAAKSIRKHKSAGAIIGNPKSAKEVAVFKRDARTGLLLKGRIDVLTEDATGNTVVADVKTTVDAGPSGFPREMAKFRYDMQAAFYLDLVGASFFVFIAVEKVPPFAVGTYSVDEESLAVGRAAYERHLDRLAECMAQDKWPAYSEDIETISVPRWLASKEGF